MSFFDLNVSQQTIIMTGVVQGFGLGFIFAPLTTISFATLAPHLRTEGTSFYSLMRNVGSSVGISVAMTIVARMTQINHASLAEHVDPTNPIYRSAAMARGLGLDTQVGMAMLNSEMTRQASAIAYLNDFRLMMYMTALAIPIVYLMRNVRALPAGNAEAATQAVMD
jgi:DHA2 family multidrug resistance protein